MDDQVIVVELPSVTDVAAKASVGAAGAVAAVTVRVTDVDGEAPAPLVHNNVYVSVPVAEGVIVCVPVLAIAPVQLPEAVHP